MFQLYSLRCELPGVPFPSSMQSGSVVALCAHSPAKVQAKQAVEEAAVSADCVLAMHAHLRCDDFPFHHFTQVIEFVEEVRVLHLVSMAMRSFNVFVASRKHLMCHCRDEV